MNVPIGLNWPSHWRKWYVTFGANDTPVRNHFGAFVIRSWRQPNDKVTWRPYKQCKPSPHIFLFYHTHGWDNMGGNFYPKRKPRISLSGMQEYSYCCWPTRIFSVFNTVDKVNVMDCPCLVIAPALWVYWISVQRQTVCEFLSSKCILFNDTWPRPLCLNLGFQSAIVQFT